MSKSLGNVVAPQQVIKEQRRRGAAALGLDGGLPGRGPPRQGSALADGRGVPKDPQHVPVPAVEPVRLRPGAGRRAARRHARGRSLRAVAVTRACRETSGAALRRATTSRRSSTPSTSSSRSISARSTSTSRRIGSTRSAPTRANAGRRRRRSLRDRGRTHAPASRRFSRSRPTRSGAAAGHARGIGPPGGVPGGRRRAGATRRSMTTGRRLLEIAQRRERRARGRAAAQGDRQRAGRARRDRGAAERYADLLDRYRDDLPMLFITSAVTVDARRRRRTGDRRCAPRGRREVPAVLALRRRRSRRGRRLAGLCGALRGRRSGGPSAPGADDVAATTAASGPSLHRRRPSPALPAAARACSGGSSVGDRRADQIDEGASSAAIAAALRQPRHSFPDCVDLVHVHNAGVAFGLLNSIGPAPQVGC